MTKKKLWDAIDGLMAYDMGATCSGIKDDDLKARVVEELNAMEPTARRRFVTRFHDSLGPEYDLEAVRELLDWLVDVGVHT